MTEENIDIEQIDADINKENKVEERIRDLSGKVKLTSQERDELAEAKTALEQDKTKLEKERDFYKDFSATSAKYPQAGEFQDKILEKVQSGYSVEDATVSVLNSEGKLIPQKEDVEIVAGGSATITPPEGSKGPDDMTQAERRERLEKELTFN